MLRSISIAAALVGAVATLTPVKQAEAFCGFYVAKAGTDLFNRASKVIIARHMNRTVITMANEYKGSPKEFALVVPIPYVLKKEQIHVTEPKIVDHLDAYTAPRLVEYFDKDPCRKVYRKVMPTVGGAQESAGGGRRKSADALGVKIEARYTVGEYDIIILSAEQSSGLQTWLDQEGYQVPEKARKVLGSYLAMGMKFFVARVNLKEQSKLGYTYLRPLQLAFESDKFMLPIRLGTVNSSGPQELFVMTLTRGGRVESKNYRTVKMPSNFNVPIFVKDEFPAFYKALFDRQAKKESRAVFLEYAWNMAWCDPCAADPLSPAELQELGVWWINAPPPIKPMPRPGTGGTQKRPIIAPQPRPRPSDVFVTRMHMRYTAETHPDDLAFQETTDKRNFQGRYILRHPYRGPVRCEAAAQYLRSLPARFEREAQTLARATGWDINTIRTKMEKKGQPFDIQGGYYGDKRPWWEQIWKKKQAQ